MNLAWIVFIFIATWLKNKFLKALFFFFEEGNYEDKSAWDTQKPRGGLRATSHRGALASFLRPCFRLGAVRSAGRGVSPPSFCPQITSAETSLNRSSSTQIKGRQDFTPSVSRAHPALHQSPCWGMLSSCQTLTSSSGPCPGVPIPAPNLCHVISIHIRIPPLPLVTVSHFLQKGQLSWGHLWSLLGTICPSVPRDPLDQLL